MTFGGQETSMDIGKSQDNFDKDGKPKYFNCNIYKHLAKECRRPKKDKEMRKCYKYDKVEYLAKDCRSGQKMKIRRNQEDSDEEYDNKKKGFVEGLEQAQYNKPLYIMISKIDILFQINKTIKQEN